MTNKKEFLTTIDLEYYTLEEAIKTLQEYPAMYPKYTKLRLEKRQYSYDDNEYLCLYGDRPETEQEEQKRLEQEAKDKDHQLKYQLAEFERLKKVLGK